MAKLSEQLIENINIVEEISKYVDLTKKGQNYVGICPFHNDNNPSFTVNEKKKIFKCFVCGVGGNVIKFNMLQNKCSFKESLINLGQEYNFDISSMLKREENNPWYNEEKKKLITLNNDVNELFKIMLNENKKAQEYLQSRNISKTTIENFGIGYKDNSDGISSLLQNTNIDFTLQQKSGLVTFSQNKIYDFFKNRIMIPIKDEFSNIVGFGSRIIENTNEAKYINSKDSELFEKKKILFNYDVRNKLTQSNSVIIVEGYMDVISLHNQGIRNSVAIMTKSISNEQIALLTKLNKKLLLCLDFDDAGLQGTLDTFQKYPNINFEIVQLENGLDPDEYIKKEGKEKLIEKINNPISKNEFMLLVQGNQNINFNVLPPTYKSEEVPPYQEREVFENNTTSYENINYENVTQVQLSEPQLIKFIVKQENINTLEEKQILRFEITLLKWKVNEQINDDDINKYRNIINSKLISNMLFNNKNNQKIEQILKNAPKEIYNKEFNDKIYILLYNWHTYDKELETLDEMLKISKNKFEIKNKILQVKRNQRNEFNANLHKV